MGSIFIHGLLNILFITMNQCKELLSTEKKIQNEKQKAVGAYSVSEIIFFIDVKPKIWTLGAPH